MFCACRHQSSQPIVDVSAIDSTYTQMYMRYLHSNDEHILDSLVLLIEDNQLDSIYVSYAMHLAHLYTLKHECEKALQVIERIDYSVLPQSSYRLGITNHLKAIVALQDGDTLLYRRYIEEIVVTLEDELTPDRLDSLFRYCSIDSIVQSKYYVSTMQLLYYQSLLKGYNACVDSLKNEYPDFEKIELLFPLDTCFMIFEGY